LSEWARGLSQQNNRQPTFGIKKVFKRQRRTNGALLTVNSRERGTETSGFGRENDNPEREASRRKSFYI
jgi:hypothetical protein